MTPSPRPWRIVVIGANTHGTICEIYSATGRRVTGPLYEEDAHLIVQCVNAQEKGTAA